MQIPETIQNRPPPQRRFAISPKLQEDAFSEKEDLMIEQIEENNEIAPKVTIEE